MSFPLYSLRSVVMPLKSISFTTICVATLLYHWLVGVIILSSKVSKSFEQRFVREFLFNENEQSAS